jgi:dihydrofolate synthase/folylpolyglutamate synthase
VGLGGRLDSTNVVCPAVTAITSIELEHTEKLGHTLAAIAGEKAGIIKPGVTCVQGRLPIAAGDVVAARAREIAAPLRRLGVDFEMVEAAGGLSYEAANGFSCELVLPLLGEHQRDNAAIAITMIRELAAHDDAKLARAVRDGLASARLPARLELLSRRPWVLVDGAHTAASVRSLVQVMKGLAARRRHLVVSVSSDKAIGEIMGLLLGPTDVLWLTRADPIRSAETGELAALAASLAPDVAVRIVEDPRVAIRTARAELGAEDLLCCAGSVYLAGIARAVLTAAASEDDQR